MKKKFVRKVKKPIMTGENVEVWLGFTNEPIVGRFFRGISAVQTKGNEKFYSVIHSITDDKTPVMVTRFSVVNSMGCIVFENPLRAIECGKQELKVLQWKPFKENIL